MAGLDGKNPIPPGCARTEFCSSGHTHCSNTHFRKDILLRNLSFRSDAGHHIMVPRQDEKEKQVPLQLLSGKEHSQVQYIGCLYNSPAGRCKFFCSLAGTVQFIRKNRVQPSCSGIWLGQQPSCLDCGKGRKLCILQHRRMDKVNSHIRHCSRYIHSHIHSCMERRKDLLQHHLPCRNRSRNIFALQHSGPDNRHLEMP